MIGIIIASVEVLTLQMKKKDDAPSGNSGTNANERTKLDYNIHVELKCLYTKQGSHIKDIHERIARVIDNSNGIINDMDSDGMMNKGKTKAQLEQQVTDVVRSYALKMMKKRPDIITFVHEVRQLTDHERSKKRSQYTMKRGGKISHYCGEDADDRLNQDDNNTSKRSDRTPTRTNAKSATAQRNTQSKYWESLSKSS